MRIIGVAYITISAALVVMGSTAFAAPMGGPGPMAAPRATPVHTIYRLKCVGYGPQITFTNSGNGLVPAGTVVAWKTDASQYQPARSGVYRFAQDLPPQGSVKINQPPPPSSGGNQGYVDPSTVPLAITALESCTVKVQPNGLGARTPTFRQR